MKFRIPFVDLVPKMAQVHPELLGAVDRVLRSGHYILGPEVEAFEREFAHYIGSRHAVGVSNGTSALVLALQALGVGPGDEVVSVSNTFISTISAIVAVGATPVFADIGSDNNLDPQAFESAISKRTRAVIPVHLSGRPCDMDQILAIARKHGIFVVEDAAQAAGARWGQKRVGSFGEVGCFSLHPLKNLHAFGDAGVVVTDDDALAEKIRCRRNIGLISRNEAQYWAMNDRLDELQAALLRVNLAHLDEWNAQKRRTVQRYNDALRSWAQVPEDHGLSESVYQVYVLRTPRRDAALSELHRRGIDARIHYPSLIHNQELMRATPMRCGDLTETLRSSREILSLPAFIGISESAQGEIIDVLRRFYAGEVRIPGPTV